MGWKSAPDAAFTKELLAFPTIEIKEANFDSKGNITDVRFGVDTGVSVAFFGGLEVSIQAGGIYVFFE